MGFRTFDDEKLSTARVSQYDVTTQEETVQRSGLKACIRGLISTFSLLCLTVVFSMPNLAEAREVEECQQWWGQAVRSYLTRNRTKGPEDDVFKSACELEAKGDKVEARVEAITIGVRELAALDMKGCKRFMKLYVGATLHDQVCDAAAGEDFNAVRKLVANSIPPPPSAKAAK